MSTSKINYYRNLPPAARGTLFEKTAPLDPPQKLLIKGDHGLQPERTFMQTMIALGLFMVRRLKRRLKASIPGVQATLHQLHDIRYFDAFAAGSVQLKKPSGGPKGLIGPPCHGEKGGNRKMKVAISTDNNEVSGHFGRCQHYTIFEVDGKEVTGKTVIDTPGHQPGMLPPFLSQKGVNVVIAGGMGPRAQNLFRQMNIEPIIGVTGKVDEVILDFLQDKLETGESTCDQGQDYHNDCHHD